MGRGDSFLSRRQSNIRPGGTEHSIIQDLELLTGLLVFFFKVDRILEEPLKMVTTNVLFFIALFFGVKSMAIDQTGYPDYSEDLVLVDVPEGENVGELMEMGHPVYYGGHRTRRQVHGVMSTNPDGSVNINGQLPLAGNGRNVLSAVGGVDAFQQGKGKYGSATAGLALDNVAGHGLSVTNRHIGGFGDQLTAAGRLNLLNTNNHNLNANAFATRTMPNNPHLPNFNTVGGGLDYMYNNKVGASLTAAHTDLFKRTDLSAMGKFNLFKSPSSSLDLTAGATRSMSPFIPKSSWQPSGGLTFSRFF